MRQATTHAIISLTLLLGSCKSVGSRENELSGLGSSTRASELHKAVVADLTKKFPSSQGKVWFESTMQLRSDWFIQSPDGVWGLDEATLPKNVECKTGTANCDKQFTRYLCSTDADCAPYNAKCAPLAASVAKPGQSARKMCLGASDHLLDRFYNVITSADKHVDITSLSLPTGRFYPMLVNASAFLTHKKPAPTIRILTAGKVSKSVNALNQPQALVKELAAEINKVGGNMSALRMDFGYLSSLTALSWNHSKIIIADSNRVVQGGHNFYDPDYLEDHSVFDVSMEFQGSAATGVQSFVNRLWELGKVSVSPFGRYPYDGGLDALKPSSWTKIDVPVMKPTTVGRTKMIGVGRLGTYGDNPSDESFLSLIRHAKRSIYIAQEDIFSKIPLPGVKTIQAFLKQNQSAALPALVDAILDGKSVRIAQTDQAGAGLDGYGMMNAPEAQTYIVQALVTRAKERKIAAKPGKTLAQSVCEMFEIVPWRYNRKEPKWGASDRSIGSHPKIIIADESVFYLGSHNFYPANLQEFGVIVTDEGVTEELLQNYWNKIWENSSPSKIPCDRKDLEVLPS